MTPSTRSKKAKKWFAGNISDIMEWPPQSPDLNTIENLWTDVKATVHTCNPTSNEALWMVVKASWEQIPITRCQDLLDSMSGVIANKGTQPNTNSMIKYHSFVLQVLLFFIFKFIIRPSSERVY